MHLLSVIFMSSSLCAVCKTTVTVALFDQYDSQCTQTSQNTECPVSYSVYCLFNYIFIKYLFSCENNLSSKVKVCLLYTFTFNPFSNDFTFLKYELK